MGTDYSDAIRTNLESKSSDELLRIWNDNDRNEWSPAAFDVIQSILRARGVSFEPHSTAPPAPLPPPIITPLWKRILSSLLLFLSIQALFWHSSQIIALKLLEKEQLVQFNSGRIAVTAIFTFGLLVTGAALWSRWPMVAGVISLGLSPFYLALSLMKLGNPTSALERVRPSACAVVAGAGVLIGLVLILSNLSTDQRRDRKPSFRSVLLLSLAALGLGLVIYSRVGSQNRLIADLKNPNPEVRIKALVALGEMEDPGVVEPVNAALKDSDAKVRFRAAAVLAARKDPRSVEPLVATLRDPDSDVRLSAAIALREIGERSVLPLVAALKDENREVRASAAWALGDIKDPNAVEPLLAALLDKNSGIEYVAAQALAKIGEPAANRLAPALRDRNLALIAKTYLFFIARAEPGSEDVLAQALNAYGTVEMAHDYLDCNNPVLAEAAHKWVAAHGYSVHYIYIPKAETQGVHWGSQR